MNAPDFARATILAALLAACSEPTSPDAGTPSSDAASTIDSSSPCSSGCDDAISCTDDVCGGGGACEHRRLHARCGPREICDRARACIASPPCAEAEDCADDDPCSVESCDAATATCLVAALDTDRDGEPPRVCGGNDCDDSNPDVRPGATETCNGEDDDCDGIVDDGFECAADTDFPCTTTCGSASTARCGPDCSRPSVCPIPAESCNGEDDDCDALLDEDFPCVAGAGEYCVTTCGAVGTAGCSAMCTPTTACEPIQTCSEAREVGTCELSTFSARISDPDGTACLPRALSRVGGTLRCAVVELLALGQRCADLVARGRDAVPVYVIDGREACRVREVPDPDDGGPATPPAPGWHYDIWSSPCSSFGGRIAYTSGAAPAATSETILNCVQEVYVSCERGEPCRSGTTCYLGTCVPEGCPGGPLPGVGCASGLICDATFRCVDPLCGTGDRNGVSLGVGDACAPEIVPSSGFIPSEVYFATAPLPCATGLCLIAGLDGDPRPTCDPSGPTPCADPALAAERIYCSCRCDGPVGDGPYCTCPSGFTCTEVIDASGGNELEGSYCIRDGTWP